MSHGGLTGPVWGRMDGADVIVFGWDEGLPGSAGPAAPAEDGSAAHAQPAASDEPAAGDSTPADPTDRLDGLIPTVAAASPGPQPCVTPGACAARDVGALQLFGAIPPFTPTPGVALSAPEAPSVEDVLEHGLRGAGSSPVHLAFRGTASGSSARLTIAAPTQDGG